MHSAINWKMLYTSVSAIIRQYLLAIQSICYGRSLFVPAFAFACGAVLYGCVKVLTEVSLEGAE